VDWVYVCIARKGMPMRALFSSHQDSLLSGLRRACSGALAAVPQQQQEDRRAEVRALARALRTALRPLVERCNAPGAGGGDKLRATQESVRAAQSSLLATINKATEREGLLEELDVKTKRVARSAEAFASDATTLKRYACCRLWYMYLIAFFAAAVTVAVILLVTKYGYHYW
jgi:hypothetical protein